MTYNTVIDSFISMLESTYELDCMVESVTTTGETTSSTYENPAYKHIVSIVDEMEMTRKQIFSSLDMLFDDPDIEESPPDTNFQIINGYADGSQSFEKYNESTEEFEEDASYFYVRGNLYDMLPKANEGAYINKFIERVRNVVEICNQYQIMYDDYQEPPSSGEDGVPPISKLEFFWTEEYDEFQKLVDASMSGFSSIKEEYAQLMPFIRKYKSLYSDVAEELGKIDNFISSLNKTVNAPGTRLSDSYSKIGTDGFSMYSSSLGTLYDLFLQSVELYNNSKYYASDEYNMYLRKIFTYKVLEKYKFFETSSSYLSWIEDFRKRFDI